MNEKDKQIYGCVSYIFEILLIIKKQYFKIGWDLNVFGFACLGFGNKYIIWKQLCTVF